MADVPDESQIMTTPVRTKRKRVQGVKIPDAIRLMTEQYGPFEEEPRLDPAHEAVFTILSQHTSDINSARAFGLLMDRFGTLEAVARGDVAIIEEAISPGGLAKVKAPRIKLFLNRILELNGSLDLSFLREMPLAEAKSWLRQLPGIGPKSAGIILNFSLGMPAMAIDTHIYRVCQRLRFIGPKVTVDKAHEITADKRSRGELVLDALDHADAATAAEALTAIEPNAYRSFNMVVADNRDAFWLAARNGDDAVALEEIPGGLSMLTSQERNDMANPRTARYLPRFEAAAEPDPEAGDWSAWRALLASRDCDPAVGPSGSMCIVTDWGFGTVSSSLLALPSPESENRLGIYLFAPGRPDETPYEPIDA